MTYLVEIRETRTYSARIEAVSESAAAELLKLRIVDVQLYPDSMDTDVQVFPRAWCEACGEMHFAPCPVKKPAESERLIPSSWQRKQL